MRGLRKKGYHNKRFGRTQGFTLVETLVAVTILMIVMVALMSLARVGISQSITSKERVTAYFLAQDAMQYIVNMHYNDIRSKNANNIEDHIRTRCDGSLGCRVNTTSTNYNNAIQTCNNANQCRLRRDGSTYGHTGQPNTMYHRHVYASFDVSEPHDTQVRVVVSWRDDEGETRTVEIYRQFLAIGTLLGS